MNLNPDDAAAYCGRGAAYLESGVAELAFPDLNEAIRLAPDSFDAYRCVRRPILQQYNTTTR